MLFLPFIHLAASPLLAAEYSVSPLTLRLSYMNGSELLCSPVRLCDSQLPPPSPSPSPSVTLQVSFLPKFSIHIETRFENNNGSNDNVSVTQGVNGRMRKSAGGVWLGGRSPKCSAKRFLFICRPH